MSLLTCSRQRRRHQKRLNEQRELLPGQLRHFSLKLYHYTISSSFRKMFNVSSSEIVYWCRYMFNCVDVEDTLSVRKGKFLQKYCLLDNTVCALCRQQADIELVSLN